MGKMLDVPVLVGYCLSLFGIGFSSGYFILAFIQFIRSIH